MDVVPAKASRTIPALPEGLGLDEERSAFAG